MTATQKINLKNAINLLRINSIGVISVKINVLDKSFVTLKIADSHNSIVVNLDKTDYDSLVYIMGYRFKQYPLHFKDLKSFIRKISYSIYME